MRIVILPGSESEQLRPLTDHRPKALLHLAGNTLLGHILHALDAHLSSEVIFVLGDLGDQTEAWVRSQYPGLNCHFIAAGFPLDETRALWSCRDYLQNDQDLLVVSGDTVVEADYRNIVNSAAEQDADVIQLVKARARALAPEHSTLDKQGYLRIQVAEQDQTDTEQIVVGANWYRNSRELTTVVEHVLAQPEQYEHVVFLSAVNQALVSAGGKLITQQVYQWSDTRSLESLLQTNGRLLSVGLHSADAIERSYAEDFTVLPPVYLHPDAEVRNAVIGPYVSIAPQAVLSNTVVRNSIVNHGAQIANCVLDGALIGEAVKITGRGKALVVGDHSTVELD